MWDQYLAGALAYRGHLRDAYSADRRLLQDASASPFSGFFDPFLVLSLLGVVPDSVARATFARALVPDTPWAISSPRATFAAYPGGSSTEIRSPSRASSLAPPPRGARRPARTSSCAPDCSEVPPKPSSSSPEGTRLRRCGRCGRSRTRSAWPRTSCRAASTCIARSPSCWPRAARSAMRVICSSFGAGRRGSGFVLGGLESARLAEQLGRREDAVERFRLVTEARRWPDRSSCRTSPKHARLERLAAASR